MRLAPRTIPDNDATIARVRRPTISQLWKAETNAGFSSFAVAGGKAYTIVTREAGRLLSLAAFVAAAFLLAGFISAGGSVLLVLGTGFAAQGLAVVHWTAEQRRWPGIWPLIIYGPLLLGPPPAGAVLLALAIVGLVDNGVGLRRHRSKVV